MPVTGGTWYLFEGTTYPPLALRQRTAAGKCREAKSLVFQNRPGCPVFSTTYPVSAAPFSKIKKSVFWEKTDILISAALFGAFAFRPEMHYLCTTRKGHPARNVPIFLPVLIISHLRFKTPALGPRSTAVSRH